MTLGDPKRIFDDPAAEPLGRSLLRSADAEPTPGDVEALWRALGTRVPGLAGATKAKAAGAASLAKGASILGALGAAAIGVAILGGLPPRVPVDASVRGALGGGAAAAAPQRAPAGAVETVGAPVERVPAPAEDRAAPPATARPAAPMPVGHPKRSPATPATRVSDEADLVLRARALFGEGDCAAALGPLGEARSRFPHGDLSEEREVLAIESLACTGRGAEAAARAAAFACAYPGSFHAAAMRRFAR